MRLDCSSKKHCHISPVVACVAFFAMCAEICGTTNTYAADSIGMRMDCAPIQSVHDSAIDAATRAVRLSDLELPTPAQREYQLLMFHATWCGPCRQFKKNTLPQLGMKFSEDGREAIFLIDSDKSPQSVKAYNVAALPCYVLIHREGDQWKQVRRTTGSLTVEEFRRSFPELGK